MWSLRHDKALLDVDIVNVHDTKNISKVWELLRREC